MSRDTTGQIDAPAIQRNWQQSLRGSEAHRTYEFEIYSDAPVSGGLTLGPWDFTRLAAPFTPKQTFRPVYLVRVTDHLQPNISNPEQYHAWLQSRLAKVKDQEESNEVAYHGATDLQVIAALSSLFLGARAATDGITREYAALSRDRFGSPQYSPAPSPPFFPLRNVAPLLPSALETNSIMDLQPLRKFPDVSAGNALALIRAARLYQHALWVAESETNLAWLLLTSAAEAIAAERSPGKHRVTRKFCDFLCDYLPDAPTRRPPPRFQITWTAEALRASFGKVYDLRSRALHAGTPFPAPLLDSTASQPREWEASEEKPTHKTGQLGGSTWHPNDLPIYIHIFEHIVRGAILNWWESVPTGLNS